MLPDRVSNPGPLTYESGVLPIALRGPANPERKVTLNILVQAGNRSPFEENSDRNVVNKAIMLTNHCRKLDKSHFFS